jgi:hypothetical protein
VPHLPPVGAGDLTAKNLKVTLVLQAAEVAAFPCPNTARITLSIRLPDRTVTVDLAAKSVRRAQAAIREYGTEVACILQGRLGAGDVILEAGLSAQPKAAKTPKPEAA